MAGLSSSLLKQLRETLLDCGPFGSDTALAGVFVDERIAPWRNQISEAHNGKDRVDLFVSDFHSRRNRAGRSVLALFLQVLHDRAIEEDDCHRRLNDLAVRVAVATSGALPPLARHNLWRASCVGAGEETPPHLAGYALPAAEAGSQLRVEPLPPNIRQSEFTERLESLKHRGNADWLPVGFLEDGLRAARAVGRVEHQGRKIGTAFLVDSDLVLTSAHVVRDTPVLQEAGVRFSVGLQAGAHWRYFVQQVAYSPVEELDFALVQLGEPVGEDWAVVLSQESTRPDQPANILQYPEGGLLQVALRYNAIVHVGAERLYYVADTERGSSGSPVFDDNWKVIAVHRAGIVDSHRRPVRNANQGVPILAIEPHVRPYIGGG